ncbi:MAG: NAD(P)H-dependent oxidoreductase, partial [Chloroflexi bacterium]|nr:NAD(P)H-dependent oxidoreductase [Chloroflexota bacterium]
CSIKDDMEAIYPKLLNNKFIIIASPIFFYGLTSQLKAMIDRSQAIWARKHILKWKIPNEGRKGAFIAVGATKGNNLFEGSVLTIKYFFKTIGVEYSGELLVRSVDRKGEILENSQALVDAFELGKNLVQNVSK